jgi:alpha-ketoglutarate-dependent taurine dioxygenase
VSTQTKSRLNAEQIKPNIGTRILNSKEELLSGELADAINDTIEDRGVVVFPGVHFTDEEQLKFTDTLGGSVAEMQGSEVFKVTLDGEVGGRTAAYLKASLYWHIDGTMHQKPIRASILTAIKLSEDGGDTDFANTAAAYDGLDDKTKAEIADMRVVHSFWRSQLFHTPQPTDEDLAEWQSFGEAELPLVCTAKSGRKSLVLGNTAHYIKGLDPKESHRILHGLRNHATGDEYSYTHKWTLGDTVIWNNRTSLHRATPYDPSSGRLMHRTILQGGEAWES